MRAKIFFVLLSLNLLALGVSSTHAKPFYQGKIIKLIVGTKPGGGYDFYARLMARFMQKHLPGSTFIVKNVPGAGHIIGTNEMYQSKPDGLTLGAFNRALGITQVVGMKGVRFDFKKMNFLGSPSTEIYSLLVSTKKFNDLNDVIKAEKVKLASSGLGSINYVTAMLFFRMMGLDNLTLGTGYAGGETELSIIRGEMDGCFGSFHSRKSLIDSGDARVVLFIGKTKPPGYENVPYIQDVIKEEKYKPVIDLLYGLNLVGRPFAGPPGIPKDRLKILRQAFKKAVYDPELRRVAKKAERPIEFVSPGEVEAWAEGLFKLPPDVVKILKEGYGIQ